MSISRFSVRFFIIAALLCQIVFQKSMAQSPNASFTTLPASSVGLVTICQGQQITFINTSTNTVPGATYTWNFGTGATPTTATGIGPHNVIYNSVTTTNGSLTVVNTNGLSNNSSLSIQVNTTPTSNITLANSGSSFATTTSGGLTLFRNCSVNLSTAFLFNVTSYQVGTTQTFNWGDGSPNSTQANLSGSNQITHTYGLGQFTHSVVLPNGCQVIKQYTIFNGEAPIITVSGSGQTTCLPFPYSVDILSNNIPGTNYNVSFSDGSPASLFTTVNFF
jgi:hypothetical protein